MTRRIVHAALWWVGCASGPVGQPLEEAVRESTIIPLVLEARLPNVNVEVAGAEYPLMFDLGDGRDLTLSPEIADAAGAVPTGETVESVDALGNRIIASRFRVPSIRVGAAVFHQVVGVEDIMDPSYPSPNPNGSIGRFLFGKGVGLLVDYPDAQLEVLPGLEADRWLAGRPCLPIEEREYGLVSELETSEGPLRFLWDTGAQACILRDDDASMEDSPPPKQLDVHMAGTAHTIAFLPFPFREPPVDGYIGYDFFAKHRVLFHLGRRCVVIDP